MDRDHPDLAPLRKMMWLAGAILFVTALTHAFPLLAPAEIAAAERNFNGNWIRQSGECLNLRFRVQGDYAIVSHPKRDGTWRPVRRSPYRVLTPNRMKSGDYIFNVAGDQMTMRWEDMNLCRFRRAAP